MDTATVSELTELLLDEQFYAGDPHPTLARLRREAPVVRDRRYGFWALTRHRDVYEVSRDNDRFVSGYGVNLAHFVPEPLPVPGSLLSCDPPIHTHYRRTLWDAFTPTKIRALAPLVRARAVALLDAFEPDAPTEIVSQLAVPYPLIVLAELLGLPIDDWHEYGHWMDAAVRTNNPNVTDDDRAVVDHMRTFLLQAVAERRGTDAPGVIIASEGADFLEGRLARLDEAHRRWTLRHLQLTHYRVNELGDIQTEPPVHGGLTDFGAEVIRRCNQLGVVVDVAHGTMDLVRRAASVTTKPLVLSHTSLTGRPGPHSRQISAEHAKLVAGTDGVIGIWPPRGIFPHLLAMAAGITRMAGVVGIDHVGLGSDMSGLVGGSAFPDYDRLPALAEALLEVGLSERDVGKVLGGNEAVG